MSDINAKNITEAGYEFDQLDPNVFLIKNFLSEEECNFFYNLAESKTEQDWLGDYLDGVETRSEKIYGTRDLEQTKLEVTTDWNDKVVYIREECRIYNLDERLAKLFNKDLGYFFRSFGIIQRQYTGSELRGHYDQYVDERMKWAAVVYINDNYNGGEFYFREKNISIKPPRKSMLVFPATEEYWHGVKVVNDGPVRYAMPSFIWTEKDVY